MILEENIIQERERVTSSHSRKKADANRVQRKRKISNKEFERVTYFFVALFLVMMGYIVYFNAVKSKDIINSPYNVRLDSMADRVVRGKILDQDGQVLAETIVAEDGSEKRNYPYGAIYGHVVGYDSHGKSGLESLNNFDLLTSNAFFAERIVKEIQEEKNIGDNVITTLNTELQQAAYNALGDFKGAVVVMEPSTGKILTLVSKPSFDPNTLDEDWSRLIEDENSSLLNRAMQGLYAPGSTFKLVTTLAYMRENKNIDSYSYDCNGEYSKDGTTIHCASNRAHGLESLADSFAYSCNASYSNMGLTLENNTFKNAAEDLLFNSKLPNLLSYNESKFQLTKNSDAAEIMMTSIGQGKTLVSPYHMALIAAAVANGGILMQPYLVDQVANYTGATIDKNMPEKFGKLMSSEEAAKLKEYMMAVTDYGTGSLLQNGDYSVAGKTGTAEYSTDKNKTHSWFMGFTNVENPELAISVIVESADQTGKSATAVAKKVFDAYYY